MPHASIDFPCCAKFGYRYLAKCVRRYDTVDDLMDALVSRQNCCAVEEHNMALLNAGLLLIYRVASIGKLFGSRYLKRIKDPKYLQKITTQDLRSLSPFPAILLRRYTLHSTIPHSQRAITARAGSTSECTVVLWMRTKYLSAMNWSFVLPRPPLHWDQSLFQTYF